MTEQTILKNPLLDRLNKLPGETVRLPSLGKFYESGELADDVRNGEITLNAMTMTDEILMKTPDMLFQGTAIETVLRRCSPQILKPLDLLTSDVDYILTHLRRISFGTSVDIKYVCSNTECAKEQVATIPLAYFTDNSKDIDFEEFDRKHTLMTKLDKREVKLKPITFRDYLAIQQVNVDNISNPEELADFVTDSFAAIIKSVDTLQNDSEQNRKFIQEWLKSLPRKETERIMKAVDGLQDWGPTFKYNAACSHCGHTTELSTELNPTAFFMLPSSPETAD